MDLAFRLKTPAAKSTTIGQEYIVFQIPMLERLRLDVISSKLTSRQNESEEPQAMVAPVYFKHSDLRSTKGGACSTAQLATLRRIPISLLMMAMRYPQCKRIDIKVLGSIHRHLWSATRSTECAGVTHRSVPGYPSKVELLREIV